MNKKASVILPFVFVVVILLSILTISSIGIVSIPMDVFFDIIKSKLGFPIADDIPPYYEVALWQLRLPRIIMSALVGASLAICGCVFQTIFRNPICDPYILGISSGASLGAAVAFILGWDVLTFGVTIPALITALLTLFLIMGVNSFAKYKSSETLLLTGIAINFLISAVITLLIVVNKQEMHKIIFWTMGSFSAASWKEVLIMAVLMGICIFPLFFFSKDLNIMQMGDDTAKNLGVNTRRVTYLTLIFSSLLIATAVSFCGVIGFIGLIIPHIVRLIFGNNNRRLFLYSLFFGAFFLMIADTLARTLAAPSELPVGSVTAIAGAPYFLYLLLFRSQHNAHY